MLFGGFVSSLLLIAAFVMSLWARKHIKALAARLEYAERTIDRLRDDLAGLRAASAPQTDTRKGQIKPGEQDTSSRPAPASPPAPGVVPPSQPPKAEPASEAPPPASVPTSGIPAVRSGAHRSPTEDTITEPPRPPERGSLEERLGARWAVWAGGAALALGGLFLVRYSIEAGLIGPGVRVVMGGLLAAALIAGGEWMRRHDVPWSLPTDAIAPAHIPSVLTAAGTVVAFGTIYAAHALYGFIGPAVAFVLLGATGILTMLASALHGPALAGLGLAGAFVAPSLVSSASPNFWPLALYFTAVAAAAYLLSRMRGWLWLAVCALAGAFGWGLAMILGVGADSTGVSGSNTAATMAHVLAQLVLAAFFLAYEPHAGRRDKEAFPDLVALCALAAMAFLVMTYLAAVPFPHWTWSPTLLAALVALTVTGWLSAPAATAMLLGGLVALFGLSIWPGLYMPPDRTLLAPYAARVLRLPDNVSSYLSASALWTLIPAAIAAYRIWRGPLLSVMASVPYAAAATLPPLIALVLSYLRVTQFDTSIAFALAGTSLAAGFAILAAQFDKADRENTVPAYHFAAGAFAAAAIAALAFAMTVSLSRGYLTVALALTALGTAYVASLRDLPLLRHAVSVLGAIVAARLAWEPRIMGADGVGSMPVLNWLLIGYGVPAACFWQAARLLERKGDSIAVRICDALAVSFAALLAFFQIRHLTNAGDILHPALGHVEAGLTTLTALLLSFGLARMNFAKHNPVFDAASLVLGASAVAMAAFGLAFGANPYVTGDAVGGRTVFSSLLPAYLLPGLCALYVARHARGLRPLWYTRAAGVLAVALIFLYVTLETRHAFHGASIASWLETSEPESWALSVMWLLLGIVFLAYGLMRGSLEARIASAALVTLAAAKVTLYDLAGIGGLWRALSFICLGAVLIGIGLVYQRLIFTGREQNPDAA